MSVSPLSLCVACRLRGKEREKEALLEGLEVIQASAVAREEVRDEMSSAVWRNLLSSDFPKLELFSDWS